MEDNLGLEVLFKGYYGVENDAVKAIWRDGLIIPDANVLLDLYRYSDDARDTFLNLLNNHNSRVWLPHQAAQEYFKNRPSVINEQSKNYDATLSDINDLYNSFNQKNRHPFLPPHLLGEVDGVFQGSCRLSC